MDTCIGVKCELAEYGPCYADGLPARKGRRCDLKAIIDQKILELDHYRGVYKHVQDKEAY